MLAQDVENIVRAKPNTSLGQIPPTGGVPRARVHTLSQIDTHTYTDVHTDIQRHTPVHTMQWHK